jgi:hypothetical protein
MNGMIKREAALFYNHFPLASTEVRADEKMSAAGVKRSLYPKKSLSIRNNADRRSPTKKTLCRAGGLRAMRKKRYI